MKQIALILLVIAGVATTMAFNTPQKHSTAAPASAAADNEITFFNGSFDAALKASAKQKKPIFMDSYTTWCGWCKRLDATTFKDSAVVAYLNKNFINVKMNMEAGEGPKLAQKYEVSGYPTLLFLNAEGTSIGRIGGYVNAGTFIENAQNAKSAFSNEN